MNYFYKLGDKLGASSLRSKASETNYILFDYKAEDQGEKETINKARLE